MLRKKLNDEKYLVLNSPDWDDPTTHRMIGIKIPNDDMPLHYDIFDLLKKLGYAIVKIEN